MPALSGLPTDTVWAQYHQANAAAERRFTGPVLCRVPMWGSVMGIPPGIRSIRRTSRRVSDITNNRGKTMSNVIAFLERMGQDAALRHAMQNDVELALVRAQIDPELQAAILGKDQAQIEALLQTKTNVCCGLFPGKGDEEEEEEEPSKDDDEISSQSVVRGIASAA